MIKPEDIERIIRDFQAADPIDKSACEAVAMFLDGGGNDVDDIADAQSRWLVLELYLFKKFLTDSPDEDGLVDTINETQIADADADVFFGRGVMQPPDALPGYEPVLHVDVPVDDCVNCAQLAAHTHTSD